MKKTIVIAAFALFLASCGGKQEKQTTEKTAGEEKVSTEEVQQLQELEKVSDEIIDKTDELNQQLDSLINEI